MRASSIVIRRGRYSVTESAIARSPPWAVAFSRNHKPHTWSALPQSRRAGIYTVRGSLHLLSNALRARTQSRFVLIDPQIQKLTGMPKVEAEPGESPHDLVAYDMKPQHMRAIVLLCDDRMKTAMREWLEQVRNQD